MESLLAWTKDKNNHTIDKATGIFANEADTLHWAASMQQQEQELLKLHSEASEASTRTVAPYAINLEEDNEYTNEYCNKEQLLRQFGVAASDASANKSMSWLSSATQLLKVGISSLWDGQERGTRGENEEGRQGMQGGDERGNGGHQLLGEHEEGVKGMQGIEDGELEEGGERGDGKEEMDVQHGEEDNILSADPGHSYYLRQYDHLHSTQKDLSSLVKDGKLPDDNGYYGIDINWENANLTSVHERTIYSSGNNYILYTYYNQL